MEPALLILSLDPGVHHCGCALWAGSELLVAALVKNSSSAPPGAQGHRLMATEVAAWAAPYLRQEDGSLVLVLERPQVYQENRQPVDLEDLLDVYGVACAIVALLRPQEVFEYHPHDWKGSVPKAVKNTRDLAQLKPEEGARLKRAGALTHNIVDGIGLGLYHLRARGLRRWLPPSKRTAS